MNRTLGFFLGSAAVFGLLVFMLGRPVPLAPPVDRHMDARSGTETTTAPIRIPAPSPQREKPPPVTVAQPQPVLASSEMPLQPAPATEAEPALDTAAAAPDENALAATWLETTPAQPVDDLANSQAADTMDQLTPPDNVTDATLTAAQAPEPEWFPVWDPFHSELSANAFARRLERVTGLDYRVIKTSATNYRVAMGYRSEEERLVNLEMIEEATGLSINGGSR